MTYRATGAAGVIGSNFVLDWLAQYEEKVINFDDLTYVGNLEDLASLNGDARHTRLLAANTMCKYIDYHVYSIGFAILVSMGLQVGCSQTLVLDESAKSFAMPFNGCVGD